MPYIQTVLGPVSPDGLGKSLVHEHILVDWSGADNITPGGFDPDEVVAVMGPMLGELAAMGYGAFFDCTPAFVGRDAGLLKRISTETGLHVVTNTGYYKEPYIPAKALGMGPRELADTWIREFHGGIDGTGIKPGFVKIAVHPGALAQVQVNIVTAAAIASMETGMPIVCHTSDDESALGALDCAINAGLDPRRLVLAHADGLQRETLTLAHGKGAWLSLDCVGWKPLETHVDLLAWADARGMLGSVLISHDAGWYTVGKPGGGPMKPYTTIEERLLPALPEGMAETLLVTNPSRAMAITCGRS